MVSPSSRRRAVQISVESGWGGVAQSCRALRLARSVFYRGARPSRQPELERCVLALSQRYPRYGYRRITALMRREGYCVNAKRVARLRRREGLQVQKRQRRMKRVGLSTAQRHRGQAVNEVWSWDFVQDQTAQGSRFRILTLIDEYSRQCLALHAAWSIRSIDVITVVEKTMQRYGCPQHLRSDNGPEFIAYQLQDWLKTKAIKTLYIKPGAPWENGYIESFHDKLRDECLNRELFGNLLEAQIILKAWRKDYNEFRPHSALAYQTPQAFARRAATPNCVRATPSLRSELPLIQPISKYESIAELQF